MLVQSPNKRVEKPEVGRSYWCSSPFGLDKVILVSMTETNAVIRITVVEERTVNLADIAFYNEKPIR